MMPRGIYRMLIRVYSYYFTYYKFLVYNVDFSNFRTNGIPVVDLCENSKLIIGLNLQMNNGQLYNRIGRQQPCFFVAAKGGTIKIGDNVGMSSTAIHCNVYIEIGSNVKIGGNTVIYDTDFHSLNYKHRLNKFDDGEHASAKAVVIKDNVFIGSHSTILKGVTIGKNSIIAACSLVSKDVPENEIWGGNPAMFIKKALVN
jgi:acetyltransferase-like isoleucine patch superfamily enzyme